MNQIRASVPKAQRYTLWQLCEKTALLLLKNLLACGHLKGQDRLLQLQKMSQELDLLKVLIRLAKDTRAIQDKQALDIQKILQEIGRMLGGWIKSLSL